MFRGIYSVANCTTKWNQSFSCRAVLDFKLTIFSLCICVIVRHITFVKFIENLWGWHVWISQELMSHLLNVAHKLVLWDVFYICTVLPLLQKWCSFSQCMCSAFLVRIAADVYDTREWDMRRFMYMYSQQLQTQDSIGSLGTRVAHTTRHNMQL